MSTLFLLARIAAVGVNSFLGDYTPTEKKGKNEIGRVAYRSPKTVENANYVMPKTASGRKRPEIPISNLRHLTDYSRVVHLVCTSLW